MFKMSCSLCVFSSIQLLVITDIAVIEDYATLSDLMIRGHLNEFDKNRKNTYVVQV